MLSVNPPGDRLGLENAVLSGSGTRHYVPDFQGCLSIKSVVKGTAIWETENRRFVLNEDTWLMLNDGQRYTITIDSLRPVTTFCLFFERGFVEDIYRSQVKPVDVLLDSPHPPRPAAVDFFTRLEPANGPLMNLVKGLQTELAAGRVCRIEWDEKFIRAGEMLVLGRGDTMDKIARLPAVRKSTRVELYRRLLRGRDFLLSSLSDPVRLKDIAAAACLSPFHFHRTFVQAFGETPHRYLTRQRLHRAAKLLHGADLSATDICIATGFESFASFSNLFRRNYGVPPGKFSKIRQAEGLIPLRPSDT